MKSKSSNTKSPAKAPAEAVVKDIRRQTRRHFSAEDKIRIVLDGLRVEGFDVRPEDVARLSPLGFKHINMLGRYAFTLPETVARGELRPLRDPNAMGIDDP